jgi:hypothetical protein
MGVVFQARHVKLDRVVALKMIRTGAGADESELTRFRTEAEAVARLQHPNIVQIYEVGEHDGLPYCALEFVAGGTLARKSDGAPQPTQEAAALVQTLARAVQAAHRCGVLHRDLKPANVLLTPEGAPKITDFGLAKKLDTPSEHTQTGAIMGTPSYMAPEQASGKTRQISPAVDIYALGAVLYELLIGRPPFRGATPLDTIMQVTTMEPVAPSRLNPKVPRDLESICLKCLQKLPADRYPTAGELADDLGRYLRGEPTRARPVGRVVRTWRWCKRHPLPTGLLILGVAIGVAVPRITSTNTPTPAPAIAPAPDQVTVEEWKEAEELLATAGQQNPLVYRYSGGDVDFWMEVGDGANKQRFPREGASHPRQLDRPAEGDEVITGYCILTRAAVPNDKMREEWAAATQRSRGTKQSASTVVSMPQLQAFKSESQEKAVSGSFRLSVTYPVWRTEPVDPRVYEAAQQVLWFSDQGLAHRLAFPAASDQIHFQAAVFISASVESRGFGTFSNPLPIGTPVCLKEYRRERKQVGATIEQHVLRIMCQVVSGDGPAAEDGLPPK